MNGKVDQMVYSLSSSKNICYYRNRWSRSNDDIVVMNERVVRSA